MKYAIIIAFLILANVGLCGGRYSDSPNPPRSFWGSVQSEVTTDSETFIGCLPVEDVLILSVTATVPTTDDSNPTGSLYIYGSMKRVTSHLDSSVFTVNDGTAIQSWSAVGEQSTVNIENIEPCRYLLFTATISTAATKPSTPALAIRGFKYGGGGEQIW